MQPADLNARFMYHPPRSHVRALEHAEVRDLLHNVAVSLAAICPDGRELSLVMTKLEEAMFWANAALARSPDPEAE